MADYKAITDDQQKEAKIYEGNSGDVDKISQEIDSTQTSLNKLIAVMAGGAVGIISGIVVVFVDPSFNLDSSMKVDTDHLKNSSYCKERISHLESIASIVLVVSFLSRRDKGY